MSSISAIRLVFFGGTEEERRTLTDAITYVLIEHGVNVGSMQERDGDDEPPGMSGP